MLPSTSLASDFAALIHDQHRERTDGANYMRLSGSPSFELPSLAQPDPSLNWPPAEEECAIP